MATKFQLEDVKGFHYQVDEDGRLAATDNPEFPPTALADGGRPLDMDFVEPPLRTAKPPFRGIREQLSTTPEEKERG